MLSSRPFRSRRGTTCSTSAAGPASSCCGSSPRTRPRPAPGSTPPRRRSTEAFSPPPGAGCTGGSSSSRPIPRCSSTSPTSSCASPRRTPGVGPAPPSVGYGSASPRAAGCCSATESGRVPRPRRRSRRSGSSRDSRSVRAAAADAGFRIERDEVSTTGEWDAFETSWRAGLRASPLPGAAAFAEQRRREYEDGYRAAIGFAWLILTPRQCGGARTLQTSGSTGSFAATTLRPSRS